MTLLKIAPIETDNGDPVALINLSVLLMDADCKMPINGVETELVKIFTNCPNLPKNQQSSFTFLNHTIINKKIN